MPKCRDPRDGDESVKAKLREALARSVARGLQKKRGAALWRSKRNANLEKADPTMSQADETLLE
jgi:hypothetical protein